MKRRRNVKPMAPDDPRRKNLIPAKKGEVRNPTGKNGQERLREFHDFAAEVISISRGKGKAPLVGTRAQLARLALFENVIRGDTQAQKIFTEQYQGKARQSVEISGAGGGPIRYGDHMTREEMQREIDRLEADLTDGAGTTDDKA